MYKLILKFESPFMYQSTTKWQLFVDHEIHQLSLSFSWFVVFILLFHAMIFFLLRCNSFKHCKAIVQENEKKNQYSKLSFKIQGISFVMDNGKYCKIIGIKNQKLKIKFLLAGWIENPIKSVVLTFPINKIVFPTVTLCPQDSRPDRWGTAIKIFDQLNTDCGSNR